jgi:chondroitin 4-sulfotransferase 11
MSEPIHSRRAHLAARIRCSLRYRLHLRGPRSIALELYPRDFFFVHINKTGGSSVERALGAPFLHMTAADAYEQLGPTEWQRRFTFTVVRNPWDKVLSHYRYRLARGNPALVEHPLSFTEWVCRAYGDRDPRYQETPLMFADQTSWLERADGELLVSHVARFEQLDDEFAEICRRLDRPQHTLPHLKQTAIDAPPYQEQYDDEARDVVADRFARDLEHWGYRFA